MTRVVTDNSAKILAALRTKLDAVTRKAAFEIESDAKIAIQTGAKTGRAYNKKGKKGAVRRHQASAPGEAPATDTGNLVNSGFVKKMQAARYRVGFSAAYALALEMGTVDIKARPFLMPAYDRRIAEYRKAVAAVLRNI